MNTLYDKTALSCSKRITESYSTSFTLGIKSLHKKYHQPIYGIYGMVRLADEIVDTFHDMDRRALLMEFKADTYKAIERKISTNPVLHAFQLVVNHYNVQHELIDAFFSSMEMDLESKCYEQNLYRDYIYGSAEVIGLMCLTIFCEGNVADYDRLKPAAQHLGAAFQKVNFLRDMKSDFIERGRIYFPGLDLKQFDESAKTQIEEEIQRDFEIAYQGILQLPAEARRGVYLAYRYYCSLFQKIKKTEASGVLQKRLRVPDIEKLFLFGQSLVRSSINLL